MKIREQPLRVFVDLENVSACSVLRYIAERKINPHEVVVFTKVQSFINEFKIAGISVINSYPKGKNSADFSLMAELIKNLIATQDINVSRYVLTNDKSLGQAFIHQCRTFGVMAQACSIKNDTKRFRKSGWVITDKRCDTRALTPDERLLYTVIKTQSKDGNPISNRLLRFNVELPIEAFSNALQQLSVKELIFKLKNNADLVANLPKLDLSGAELDELELKGMAALTEPLTAKQWRQKLGVSRNCFKKLLSTLTIKRVIKRCRKRRYQAVY